ncbi:MAG: hypothetical protein ACK5RG_19155 [Cyclobacteriaceae bacterium]|jgi:hypothetical protein
MSTDERKIGAKQPITWTGDLSDDCTATWAGLMLRAEQMDETHWWWAVYDMEKGGATIDDSNNYTERFRGGDISRQKAERVAQKYITEITNQKQLAKYIIENTFKITGRGIVFAGYITEGLVSVGDMIEFTAFSTLYQRKIMGVEGITKSQPDKINTGLLIKCGNDAEMDELKNWKPENTMAIIYKREMTENDQVATKNTLPQTGRN